MPSVVNASSDERAQAATSRSSDVSQNRTEEWEELLQILRLADSPVGEAIHWTRSEVLARTGAGVLQRFQRDDQIVCCRTLFGKRSLLIVSLHDVGGVGTPNSFIMDVAAKDPDATPKSYDVNFTKDVVPMHIFLETSKGYSGREGGAQV